jgi:hypothetical protein
MTIGPTFFVVATDQQRTRRADTHMYESPTITELGSVADFTRAAGPGSGTDASFAGWIEGETGWDTSHGTS